MTSRNTGDLAQTFIHYDPERIDYSVTPEELARLASAPHSQWKDFCLVSFSVGLPCVLNAIALTATPFVLTLAVFLNYLFGVLGIILAIAYGFLWRREHRSHSALLESIRSKPKMKLECRSSGGATTAFVQEEVGPPQRSAEPPNQDVGDGEPKI